MFYTYILQLSNDTYYTGLTGDLNKRFEEHNSGRSISTRNYLPAKLVYYITSVTRQEARNIEVKIKNYGAGRYLLRCHFRPDGQEHHLFTYDT